MAEPHPTGETPPGRALDPASSYIVDDRHAETFSRIATAAKDGTQRFVRRNNVLAVPALIVACLGIVTYVCAPIGAIMGHVARGQIRRRGQTGGGFALGAVIVGWTVTALYTCGIAIPILLVLLKAGAISALFS